MKKEKSFWTNPWTVTIGGGLVVLLITVIVDAITAEKIFNTLKALLSFVWNIVISFLNFRLKVWWILCGIAVIVFVLYILIRVNDAKPQNIEKPKFLEYTEDHILGLSWRWNWEKMYDGKYRIENLEAVCSNCGTPLVYEHLDCYKCLRCQNEYCIGWVEPQNVQMLIEDNVRRRYFSKDDTKGQ